MKQKYLSYFWDYPITKTHLKKILAGKEGDLDKIWAFSRLLESTPYAEIWNYISLDELRNIFPKLKLKKPIQKAWERALAVWSNP